MSIDRYLAHQEAHTDPFLPKITDADIEREDAARARKLPPLANPRVPRLDDDSVADLIAELDGDEASAGAPAPRSATEPSGADPAGKSASERPGPSEKPGPSERLGPPDIPGLSERPGPVAGPRAGAPAPVPRPRDTTERRRPLAAPARPVPVPVPGVRVEASRVEPEEEPEEQFGPDDDPSVLRLSGDGPVLRSRYGDFRPPVAVGRRRKGQRRAPDPTSLTGLSLTSRSTGEFGSRLFTLIFVAIFLLILAEAVVGIVSAAATP